MTDDGRPGAPGAPATRSSDPTVESTALPSIVIADEPPPPAPVLDDPAAPTIPAELPPSELDAAVGLTRRAPRSSRRRPEKLDGSATAHEDEPDDAADGDGAPPKRRGVVVAVVAGVVGVGIAALVFLGHANAQQYALRCEPDRMIAEQGRAFPPWGTRAIAGAEWKAIDLPPEASCAPLETEDRSVLAAAFLDALYTRATDQLTLKAGHDKPANIDVAEAQVNQALVIVRYVDAPKLKSSDIARWLGDIAYWRAIQKVRDAQTALADLAQQFDAASARNPVDVRTASAWAKYVRQTVEELRAGPGGSPTSTSAGAPAGPSASVHVPAPEGTALPVESSPSAPAQPPASAPAPTAVPSGGVLL